MSPTSIHILTFAAVALLALSVGMMAYDWCFRYRLILRGRLDELIERHEADRENATLFKDLARLGHDENNRRRSPRQWLRDLSEQAGLPCDEWWLAAATASSAILAAGCGILAAGVWGALAAPVGALVPIGVIYSRRHRRRRRLCLQLPETFQMISRAVRAGQTIPAALQIIAEDFEAPVRDEFALCYEQQNLGMSRESALRGLARRTGIMELQIFVVALLVQAKSGGDLVDLLDNLAGMIRKRLQLRERVRALTGEGRMQATILMILPTAALAMLMAMAPDYAQTLVERPWILLGALVMQGADTCGFAASSTSKHNDDVLSHHHAALHVRNHCPRDLRRGDANRPLLVDHAASCTEPRWHCPRRQRDGPAD
jgi:tight adherence protein B